MLNLLVKNWKVGVFVSFFHVICKISNFNTWTAKHLAQASWNELTLPQIEPNSTSWQYPKINYLVLITTFYSSFCSPPSSVVFWLRELCLVHEAECTIMLQSKPVGGSTSVGPAINGTGGPCAGADGAGAGSTYNQTHLGNFWAGNSKDTIRAIQSRAHAISAVFAKLCK